MWTGKYDEGNETSDRSAGIGTGLRLQHNGGSAAEAGFALAQDEEIEIQGAEKQTSQNQAPRLGR